MKMQVDEEAKRLAETADDQHGLPEPAQHRFVIFKLMES